MLGLSSRRNNPLQQEGKTMNFKHENDFAHAQTTIVLYTKDNGEKVTGKFVFRKRGEKVQVLVSKEIPLPEYASKAKTVMQQLTDFSNGLRSVTMETKIRTHDEYGYEDPTATLVLQGWKEVLSNRENRALQNVTRWV
jgi:hypothetical protein